MPFRYIDKVDKADFMEEDEILQTLNEMEENNLLNTKPSLIKDEDNTLKIVSFKQKHTQYLNTHPKVNPQNYLSNLRTMIKIR